MLADDIVQETLSKALKNAGKLRDMKQLNAWLFSIMTNCWRDHFRQLRETDNIEDIEDFQCSHETTPEHISSQTQTVTRVRAAVEKLPLGQRQVLTLVDLEEFSYVEVAAILDIPIGTVMSRLCRARQSLKAHLQELAPPQPEQANKIRRIK